MDKEGVDNLIYCCEEHVEIALDKIVFEKEISPILEEIPHEKQLSTACEYCRNTAIYMVGN